MITKPTVFVVGAGASAEAGLPIGDTLKSSIATKLDIRFPDGYQQTSGDTEITRALKHVVRQSDSENINPLLHKCWFIRDSLVQAASVDNFVQAHNHDEDIGMLAKLAITRCILNSEKKSMLYIDPRAANPRMNFDSLNKIWYSKLFKILIEGVDRNNIKSLLNKVSFIIFNYDRCVEHYLFNAIQSYYDLSDEEAGEVLNQCSFVHPYGTVGTLPWQGSSNTVQFGKELSAIPTISASNSILTFSESMKSKEVDISIRKINNSGNRIIFLGMFYHRQNLEIIFPSNKNTIRIFSELLSKYLTMILKS